jgi:hypothetical protein
MLITIFFGEIEIKLGEYLELLIFLAMKQRRQFKFRGRLI